MAFGKGSAAGGGLDDEDIETLSYKKLHKMLVSDYPVDPNSH